MLFTIECQNACFQNSRYTFARWGGTWFKNSDVCKRQGGYLISIETNEEWNFIKQKIQNRSCWRKKLWHIGLSKKSGDWIWESGNSLNISKWENSKETHRGRLRAAISKKGGLFIPVPWKNKGAYICEMHGGNKTFRTSSTLQSKTPPLAFWSWRNFSFRTTLSKV